MVVGTISALSRMPRIAIRRPVPVTEQGEGRRSRALRGPVFRDAAFDVAMTVDPSMSLRDVKNRLSEVVDQVEREHDRVVITKHGRRAAVVVSVDHLESLEETLDVMARPKLLAQIRDSLAESQNGDAKILTKDQARALLNG